MWCLDHLKVGAHIDYLYSKLHWRSNAGKARIHTLYLAPFVGYSTKNYDITASIIAARGFYNVNRHIHFNQIDRTAHNTHTSWNLLGSLQGNAKIPLKHFQDNFFICPEVQADYFNIWESDYQESGANSINLAVERKHSAFFHAELDLKFVKEFPLSWGSIAAALRTGAETFVLLSDTRYERVQFFGQETCQPFFSVEGLIGTVYQAVLGGQLSVVGSEHISFGLNYEASFGTHACIQEGSASFCWKW